MVVKMRVNSKLEGNSPATFTTISVSMNDIYRPDCCINSSETYLVLILTPDIGGVAISYLIKMAS